MLEQLFMYIKGYVRIRVDGYSPERFLNACRCQGITVWDLRHVQKSYEMNLTLHAFWQLKEIVKKTDTKVTVIRKCGLAFLLSRYRKRHTLRWGFFFCIFLILLLTQYIWSIDIQGNHTYTDDTLKRFLASRDIRSGMWKKNADCPAIVQNLRTRYDKIIWVSASVKGCRLIIRIKENEDGLDNATDKTTSESLSQEETGGTDIIADTDCEITGILTRSGTLAVQRSARVKKGDLLVSGQIPIYNDAQEITGYRTCKSDADITGEWSIPYSKTISRHYVQKKYYRTDHEVLQKKAYGIQLSDHFLTIGSLKNTYPFSIRRSIQKKQNIAGIGPLTLFKTTVTPYQKIPRMRTRSQVRRILTADFQEYCKEMQKKGVEIIQNDVKIYTGSKTYCAKGTLKIRGSVGTQIPSAPLPPDTSAEEETKNGD